MFRLVPILILLCCVFLTDGLAKVVDETEIDQKMRDIAKTLRCTVCQTENIWESGAPLAHQMREAIRERVMQGQSAEEIRAYFHSRYGDYIMMEPPKQGVNWLIWLAPFLLLFGGGALLWREVKRWVTKTPAHQTPTTLDEASRRRIERELHDNQ
jgi:cytochrome c-type biogenesis protein CcmH